ncbi:aldo/keto reductase [Allosediminivita pacifica]|uniref:Aryl-alcohol dehydrogenase-like predicted oxidoreductase n=1 Tax=Allosediminivita pacifica TaxID=1267769 RepID=A0A2T6AYE8_9RHOB|nr:aldo/keto reductase [Allosediminivita pacifica]PTX48834.1 aryl-alcohol dehydrogenase-like predicted oxidoreductase [Allosediminivita pacifica]GGB08642.1 oxidoreductase [Allosediminivita pacifica]
MKYTILGTSGLSVSTMALGTMTFGAESTEEQSLAVLDAFIEGGGNLIDTSNVYAGGETEAIIGRWFASRPKDVTQHAILATKGRYSVRPEINAHGLSRRSLHNALNESLERLQVQTIDLYQLHAADMLTPVEETVHFLADAIRAGKIHTYGLSNVTGWQLQLFVSTAERLGLPKPVSLQPQYNLLSREIEYEILPAARYNGLDLLPWSPLAGGILTGKYERGGTAPEGTRAGDGSALYEWSTAEFLEGDRSWDIVDALREIARDHDATPAQVALKWLADRPGVAAPIVGARDADQLKANLAAADLELDGGAVERLEFLSRPVPRNTYPYGDFGVAQRDRFLDAGKQVVFEVVKDGSDDPLNGKVT